MMLLIEKAVHLMTDSLRDASLGVNDVESIEHVPQLTLSKWLQSGESQVDAAVYPSARQSQLCYTVNGGSDQFSYPPMGFSSSRLLQQGVSPLFPSFEASRTSTPPSLYLSSNIDLAATLKAFPDRIDRCRSILSSRQHGSGMRQTIDAYPSTKRRRRAADPSVSFPGNASPHSSADESCTTSSSVDQAETLFDAAVALASFGRHSPAGKGNAASNVNETIETHLRKLIFVDGGNFCQPSAGLSAELNHSQSTRTSRRASIDDCEFVFQQIASQRVGAFVQSAGARQYVAEAREAVDEKQENGINAATKGEGAGNPAASSSYQNRKCHAEGCTKCAQGATKFCIAHGGGKRCTFSGCFKGARDKFFCAAHGGGKRCVTQGCDKSAVEARPCARHTAAGNAVRSPAAGNHRNRARTTA